MNTREYSRTDCLLNQVDQALRTLFGEPKTTGRPNPGALEPESELDEKTRDHTARLMRINHTGEVCAQALYQGQALTARDQAVRASMSQSAAEESDHLHWCKVRVEELGGRLSLLNPAWYVASFTLGAVAGAVGDKWSLGFVAETERQVEGHLDKHIQQISAEDKRTQHILHQMQEDEIAHGQKAMAHGGVELPAVVKRAMRTSAKLMTKSVYHL